MCLGGLGPLRLLPALLSLKPECVVLFWQKSTKSLLSLLVCCETSTSLICKRLNRESRASCSVKTEGRSNLWAKMHLFIKVSFVLKACGH